MNNRREPRAPGRELREPRSAVASDAPGLGSRGVRQADSRVRSCRPGGCCVHWPLSSQVGLPAQPLPPLFAGSFTDHRLPSMPRPGALVGSQPGVVL